ncbi:autotransporter adhesin BpaC-like [Bufo gargarizans]|uniref:autotransporter adhesin BpaC-like n=1 Tax=Bufo gargarizans TaxID=30331 RepID=UPI001CF1C755|nr:autotransporter adhesin BpaC-like [Bufo gargarizans]
MASWTGRALCAMLTLLLISVEGQRITSKNVYPAPSTSGAEERSMTPSESGTTASIREDGGNVSSARSPDISIPTTMDPNGSQAATLIGTSETIITIIDPDTTPDISHTIEAKNMDPGTTKMNEPTPIISQTSVTNGTGASTTNVVGPAAGSNTTNIIYTTTEIKNISLTDRAGDSSSTSPALITGAGPTYGISPTTDRLTRTDTDINTTINPTTESSPVTLRDPTTYNHATSGADTTGTSSTHTTSGTDTTGTSSTHATSGTDTTGTSSTHTTSGADTTGTSSTHTTSGTDTTGTSSTHATSGTDTTGTSSTHITSGTDTTGTSSTHATSGTDTTGTSSTHTTSGADTTGTSSTHTTSGTDTTGTSSTHATSGTDTTGTSSTHITSGTDTTGTSSTHTTSGTDTTGTSSINVTNLTANTADGENSETVIITSLTDETPDTITSNRTGPTIRDTTTGTNSKTYNIDIKRTTTIMERVTNTMEKPATMEQRALISINIYMQEASFTGSQCGSASANGFRAGRTLMFTVTVATTLSTDATIDAISEKLTRRKPVFDFFIDDTELFFPGLALFTQAYQVQKA